MQQFLKSTGEKVFEVDRATVRDVDYKDVLIPRPGMKHKKAVLERVRESKIISKK